MEMREIGEAEAGGVRVLLQPVAPSQSVSQCDPFMEGQWGRRVLRHPERPHLNAVRIPAGLHPLTEGALRQYL